MEDLAKKTTPYISVTDANTSDAVPEPELSEDAGDQEETEAQMRQEREEGAGSPTLASLGWTGCESPCNAFMFSFPQAHVTGKEDCSSGSYVIDPQSERRTRT